MTPPIITELPLHLEAATRDPFLDGDPVRAARRPVFRELDQRRNDGIEVRLLWNQTDDVALIAVTDARTGDAFQFEVAPREAADAFRHPYAYAPFRGIEYQTASRRATAFE
jgi:hypothetical protein